MALDFYAATGNAEYLPLAFSAADYFMQHYSVSPTTGRAVIFPAQVLESWWCAWDNAAQNWTNCCADDAPTISGMMTLLEDFRFKTRATLHADASAAIGIVRRAGFGKLRHLNVRYLWLQDHLRSGHMDLHKVAGVANAADLVTKHLGPGKAKDHMEAIALKIEGGRAMNAPTLNFVGRILSMSTFGHKCFRFE